MTERIELPGEGKWTAELLDNGVVKIPFMKGWALELHPDGLFEQTNRDDNGVPQYFVVVRGKHSPIFREDPEHAFDLPESASYVDKNGESCEPDMKVVGIICKDRPGVEGTEIYRGNLTNFFNRDGGSLEEDGVVVVVKGVRYRVYRTVASNKNRIEGCIAFCVPEAVHDGSPIEILEVEDLG